MIRPAIVLMALAAPLAACNSPTRTTARNAAAVAAAGPTADAFANQIAALPEAQRQGAFMRAISDAGFSCQKIEHAAAHAPIQGHPAWTIDCIHDNDYVALATGGDMLQIVPGRPTDATGGAAQPSSNLSNS
ncbi:MAG TPA: hypothetical protein VFT56_04515 [Sphingomonas sp.]|nr:hypothetical protein [Sphingomonas sp.]